MPAGSRWWLPTARPASCPQACAAVGQREGGRLQCIGPNRRPPPGVARASAAPGPASTPPNRWAMSRASVITPAPDRRTGRPRPAAPAAAPCPQQLRRPGPSENGAPGLGQGEPSRRAAPSLPSKPSEPADPGQQAGAAAGAMPAGTKSASSSASHTTRRSASCRSSATARCQPDKRQQCRILPQAPARCLGPANRPVSTNATTTVASSARP